jgi:outer membrane protein assembly factor BamB
MRPASPRRLSKTVLIGAAALAIVVVVVVVVLVSGGSSSPDNQSASTPKAAPAAPAPSPSPDQPATPSAPAAQADLASKRSGYPNVDLANTRNVAGPITAANVSTLSKAWSHPLTAASVYGSYSSSPVVVDGVIYSQDLASNVEAIDLRTGAALWRKDYDAPDQGPNGITVAGGRVYGATDTSAFALDRKTGKEVWSVKLVDSSHKGIDMAPGYHHGLVYISTVPGNAKEFYKGGGPGVLYALNAATGKKVWSFNTNPLTGEAAKHADINSGGGLWYTPAFDSDGSMYIGVGNPGPFPGTDEFPWGSSRPGPNLYTNSLVKLDAATGKLQWYYQLTPHDIYDWDLQDPPILAKVKGEDAVLAAGKGGIVIAVDRSSGKLLWQRPVGTHNGHDKDSLLAMKGQYSKLKLPMEVYPGQLGGVIAPMATDGSLVFVPVVNSSQIITAQGTVQAGQASGGEVVAIDLDTGKIKWDQTFRAPAFGATMVANDVVFATTYDGVLHALDATTGKVAWETTLPVRTNTGVVVDGDTVIAPAGAGPGAAILGYRLGGGATKP